MAGTGPCAGATAGSAAVGPSAACSSVYCCGVSSAPPTGSSGPVTCLNSLLAWSSAVARASGCGSCQTGVSNRKMMLVGFDADCGKCLASSAWPAAESLPAGGAVFPPNPAEV